MKKEEVLKGLEEVNREEGWFQQIELGYGILTKPARYNRPLHIWNEISRFLPQDLNGKTVLDVGCNNGFYCLKMAQRGALVTGIDVTKKHLDKARFAVKVYGYDKTEEVLLREKDLFDLYVSSRFDIVLCLAVIHHLPGREEEAIDIVANATKETMILEGPGIQSHIGYVRNYFDKVVETYPFQGSLEAFGQFPLKKSNRGILICIEKRDR